MEVYKMKLIITAAALLAAAFCSCSTAKQAASESAPLQPHGVSGAQRISSKEELPFPVGRDISSPRFIGHVYRTDLVVPDGTHDFAWTNNIVFEPGARSAWHAHGGMLVLVTGGIGYYQEKGQPAQILRQGDVLAIPEGVEHWHGAAPDSWFSQLVVYDSAYTGAQAAAPVRHVTDEEYAALETVEFPDRTAKDPAYMFYKADEGQHLPVFTGTSWVSFLAEEPNVSKGPSLHYVVFDTGVVNDWHVHEGGQVLIATDGIGFHQLQGEPVQVLYPGDAVVCPPGIAHWHGAAPGSTFAHIAGNAMLGTAAVEWLSPVSAAELNAAQAALQARLSE